MVPPGVSDSDSFIQKQNYFTAAVMTAVSEFLAVSLWDLGPQEHVQLLKDTVDKLGSNHRGMARRIGRSLKKPLTDGRTWGGRCVGGKKFIEPAMSLFDVDLERSDRNDTLGYFLVIGLLTSLSCPWYYFCRNFPDRIPMEKRQLLGSSADDYDDSVDDGDGSDGGGGGNDGDDDSEVFRVDQEEDEVDDSLLLDDESDHDDYCKSRKLSVLACSYVPIVLPHVFPAPDTKRPAAEVSVRRTLGLLVAQEREELTERGEPRDVEEVCVLSCLINV